MQDIIRKFITDASYNILEQELLALKDDLDQFCNQPNLDSADRTEAIQNYRVAVHDAEAAHDERCQGWQ